MNTAQLKSYAPESKLGITAEGVADEQVQGIASRRAITEIASTKNAMIPPFLFCNDRSN